jgi:hypothetical protein
MKERMRKEKREMERMRKDIAIERMRKKKEGEKE